MKKTIVLFLILGGFFLIYPGSSTALELNWPDSPLGTELNANTDLTILIKYLYEWGIGLGGFAAFISLVMAGFQYLTSAGNATRTKQSLDRIKSTGLGIVLLLGSVLILNTINPQLTDIKTPEFPAELGKWKVEFTPNEMRESDCVRAELYADTNYQTLVKTISKDSAVGTLNTTIKSIKIYGGCLLILYGLTDFQTNANNPSLSLLGDVNNMEAYGETFFGSATVINLNFNEEISSIPSI